MAHFLRIVADQILARHGRDLQRVAVVLPSERAGIHLRKHLAESAGTALWSPDLLTFPRLAERISGLRIADPIEQVLLMASIVGSDSGGSVAEVIQWAPVTLRDMSEVDAHMVPLDAFYQDLQAFEEIEDWSFRLGELSPGQKSFSRYWGKAGKWHALLNERLADRGLGTAGAVERVAARNITAPVVLPWEHVWVAGANAIGPAQQRILQGLGQKVSLHFTWDSDKYYLDDPQHEAGRFLREAMSRFGPGTLPPGNDIQEGSRQVTIVRTPHAVAQAYQVASDLAALTLNERARTAVVLADEGLLLPLLQALPPDIGPLNVTMGLSLSLLPIADLARTLFRLGSDHDPRKGFRQTDLTALLLHPFLMGPGSRSLIRWFHEDKRAHVRLQELRTAATDKDGVTDRLLRVLEPMASDRPDVISSAMELISWSKQCVAADAFAGEQLYRWAALLQHLSELRSRHPAPLEASELAAIHQHLLRAVQLDLFGEPLIGPQIMGMLETRAIDHERLIILSANEGNLPKAAGDRSFVPSDIRRTFGLPSVDDAEALTSHHFHRSLQRAKEVVLIHHHGDDTEASRFIAQLDHELVPGSRTSMAKVDRSPTVNGHGPVRISVEKTGWVRQAVRGRLQRGISPSALARFLRCPLDFFHTCVLGYSTDAAPAARLGNDQVGRAVHACLEHVHGPYVGGTIEAEGLRQAILRVGDLLLDELSKEVPKEVLGAGEPLIQIKMATEAIVRYLEREANGIENGRPVHLSELELPVAGVLSHRSEDAELRIPMKGRIDRVEFEDDIVRILDYKTGRVEPRSLSLTTEPMTAPGAKHGLAVQLVCYAWQYLTERPDVNAVRAGLIPLRTPSIDTKSFLSVNGMDLIHRDRLPFLEAVIQRIIHDILDPARPFEHDPESQYCEYCVLLNEQGGRGPLV